MECEGWGGCVICHDEGSGAELLNPTLLSVTRARLAESSQSLTMALKKAAITALERGLALQNLFAQQEGVTFP